MCDVIYGRPLTFHVMLICPSGDSVMTAWSCVWLLSFVKQLIISLNLSPLSQTTSSFSTPTTSSSSSPLMSCRPSPASTPAESAWMSPSSRVSFDLVVFFRFDALFRCSEIGQRMFNCSYFQLLFQCIVDL